MQLENRIVNESQVFVREIYHNRFPQWRTFHNFHHTTGVIEACKAMTEYYKINADHSAALLIAAWFHDVGYCSTSSGHEVESSNIAAAFLNSFGVHERYVDLIGNLIQATAHGNHAETLLEEIICDADLHHLALPDYDRWAALLKIEIETDRDVTITEEQWLNENIQFLKNHNYYTGYAKEYWEKQKLLNLDGLLDKTFDWSN